MTLRAQLRFFHGAYYPAIFGVMSAVIAPTIVLQAACAIAPQSRFGVRAAERLAAPAPSAYR